MESNFRISPRILEHLGVSAYTSLKKCLAELCSNCYDADAEHIEITLPDDFQGNASIIIKDDGIGMSSKDIEEKYLFIGYNRREVNDNDKSFRKNRPVIGNKGIGKLAGFGVANTIKIVTIKDGGKSELTLHKRIFDNFETLAECKIPINVSSTTEEPGTTLELSNLSVKLKPIEANQLRRHLFKTLPNVPDFLIRVNGTPCSADDVLGTKYPIKHTIDGIGTITGYYIIANTRQKNPGLVVRVRKRAVTEPSLFGLEARSHFSFSAEKIVGEIEADFLDPYINTSRDDFLEEIEEVQVFKLYLRDFFKEIIDGIEKEAEGKRTRKLIEVPDVQEKLSKLPPHIRNKAKKVIEGVVLKLKTASDEEVNELVDWIIRYFDSNVLRELMNSIMQAEVNDVERLSALISEWGLKQMNNVTEIIKEQIDIIKKLEELIDSDKALEIEVHKLIEGNLWLVKEGLELWASDKPLKRVLDNHFDKLYKDNQDERPDLICRSRDSGNQAVIMEFKRPRVKIKMDHITQALTYESIIKAHRPNITFETYVMGREYNPDVMASKDKLAKGDLFLWSFSELLQRTRSRFEQILEILNK
ncbi:MAG: ATP-binding protein [Cyclobacteriaceae bacterium]